MIDIRDFEYECTFYLADKTYTTIKINKNFTFYNETGGPIRILGENDIILSSLAEKEIDNILLSEVENIIKFDTLYLKEIELRNNEFIISGDLNKSQDLLYNELYVNFSGVEFNCTYIENKSEIKFIPEGVIDEHLQGKIIETRNKDKIYILIFSSEGVYDHLQYPISCINEQVKLLGFGDYKESSTTSDAKIKIYFRGIIYYLNNLKQYIKFKPKIAYSSLRTLEEETFEAIGQKQNIDEDKLIAIYEVTFYNTNNKNISNIEFDKMFEFSDDGVIYTQNETEINIRPKKYNVMNTKSLDYEEIIFDKNIEVTQTSDSFSFNFGLPSGIITIENKTKAYLSFIPMENTNTEKEIECYVENKTTFLTLICSEETVHTYFKTLILNIVEVNSSERLRLLATTETNKTFYAPCDSEGTLFYYYEPQIITPTFRRRISKNKGLSGGAIAAIVLASVAAIAATGISIFFLNRMLTSPPVKPTSKLHLRNSSAKILD